MIDIKEATNENIAAAEALVEPKHIWIDGSRIVVATGKDIPAEPTPAEATYTESEVITLLKDGGKTDEQARALVKKQSPLHDDAML